MLQQFQLAFERRLKNLLQIALAIFAVVILLSIPLVDWMDQIQLEPWLQRLIGFAAPLITSFSIYAGIVMWGIRRHQSIGWKKTLPELLLEGTWLTEYPFDASPRTKKPREYAIGIARVRQGWDGAPAPTTPEGEDAIGVEELIISSFDETGRPLRMHGSSKVWHESQQKPKTGIARYTRVSADPDHLAASDSRRVAMDAQATIQTAIDPAVGIAHNDSTERITNENLTSRE